MCRAMAAFSVVTSNTMERRWRETVPLIRTRADSSALRQHGGDSTRVSSFFDWAAKDDMGPPLLLSAVAAPFPASDQFEDVPAEPVGIVAQVGIGTVQQQIVGNHMTPQTLETIDIRKNGVRP